ncbi:MAG: class I SAM-dependent methyltransferase family protein [Methanobacteriota archaeon]|nr:MAG: class I SAM-dependent methyltransferase family protein [Euryarchaeota archaeon]
MKSLCIVVPKKKAEPVRRRLVSKGVLRKGLQIRSDVKHVYLPVSQRLDLGFPIETHEFEETDDHIKDFRVLVDLPDELRRYLPSSYDVLGSIAIVKISDEVLPFANEIGQAIIATQKSIQTVCLDVGVVDEFRTRGVKVVAGTKAMETVHREYGLTFRMDVSKVFFSPRLAAERVIVAEQVEDGETVIDMFAGIGPFSILIAKTRKPETVYAIDSNPDAVKYLEENIQLNKAVRVEPILGDAREEVAKLGRADRIIMNLPHNAHKFLPEAIRALKPGGVVHFYMIMEEAELESRMNDMRAVAMKEGRVLKPLAQRKVKSYSPSLNFYAFDLEFL